VLAADNGWTSQGARMKLLESGRVQTMDGDRRAEPSLSGTIRSLFAERRSIRKFLDSLVARDVLDSLLQAAIAAPSAHNRQPWRLLVIEGQTTKRRLAVAMGQRLRADRLRDGDAAAAIERDVSRSFARLTEAPVLVLVCMSMADMDRYSDVSRNQAERTMAIQGTAMAAQNLLLAAHAAGLGACWMCAPLFCCDTVIAELGLAADWEPQGIVTLGYPAELGKPFRRRPVADSVRYEGSEP
jgi:coenzyme F420-0:L-glutamate ligase/coenzyme F420-1:gamma-L-glutamate ligase